MADELAKGNEAQTEMRARIKELTSKRHVNNYEEWKKELKQFITGWVNYYELVDMKKLLESTDEWMRRRIRMMFWKKWKRVRTKYRNLWKLGIGHEKAYMTVNSGRGYWFASNPCVMKEALSDARLERAGFFNFKSYYCKSVQVYTREEPYTERYVRSCGRSADPLRVGRPPNLFCCGSHRRSEYRK